jgi:hypothetical protein
LAVAGWFSWSPAEASWLLALEVGPYESKKFSRMGWWLLHFQDLQGLLPIEDKLNRDEVSMSRTMDLNSSKLGARDWENLENND